MLTVDRIAPSAQHQTECAGSESAKLRALIKVFADLTPTEQNIVLATATTLLEARRLPAH